MSTHKLYSPLSDSAREIRLLKFLPSPDFSAPVHSTLHVSPLNDPLEPYKALSYAWGDPTITAPIFLNGKGCLVTTNLHSALRHLRSETETVFLWADAVCIDQSDNGEKSHRVAQMGRIYRGAEGVLVWLGDEGDDSSLAVDLILSACVGDGLTEFPPPGVAGERVVNAMRKFLFREWWSRLWVVQEVVLAREVSFFCGARRIEEVEMSVGMSAFLGLLSNSSGTGFAQEEIIMERFLMIVAMIDRGG
ncbi:heterokaryon incompatibility protein-domain-containing protein [Cercophora newfieldiana]|uniref:Heterokaryon incompatibility protein-domain-containing protein n=1 Tax=Cercophora newfieldiana TaxID=92897 RepID=A0AA40CIP7_9PEZI|nr:heterokaryon incompatibility protein-domain-containing protein [Cercophora newfieldiana]